MKKLETPMTLQAARKAAGLSMAKLSRIANVPLGVVNSIEGGKGVGSLLYRHRLADALHIPLGVLWPESLSAFEEIFEAMRRDKLRLIAEQRLTEQLGLELVAAAVKKPAAEPAPDAESKV